MRLFSVHALGAFVFGFVGSIIFMVPVLLLVALAAAQPLFLLVAIAFTILWWFAWTYAGAKLSFYDRANLPIMMVYSAGSALGLIFALYYGAAINAFFGVR